MDRPLVSIIIPTHNRAEFLEDALESVAAQTYTHWECVVVDDGSTDDTETVVSQFGNRVRYQWQENAGPAVARNRGIEAANGELFLFLDSDDRLLPHAVECLYRALQGRPDAGVAYGGFYVVGADGSLVSRSHIGTPRLPASTNDLFGSNREGVPYGMSEEGNILPALLQHDLVLMGGALFRRSSVEVVEGFDPSLGHKEHWDFALRIAKKGIDFAAAGRPVLLLHRHDNNRSLDAEGVLRDRLDMIEAYLPEDHLNPNGLRASARAYAYMECAQFLCYQDRLEPALEHLSRALADSSLSLGEHIDDLNLFSKKICRRAFSSETPRRCLSAFLDGFTESSAQLAFRHFVLSRFRRILTLRAVRSVPEGGPGAWRRVGDTLVQGGRSCVHLGAAIGHHRRLAGPILSRVGKWLRWLR